MVSYLCTCIGVSKSGFYNYLKNESKRSEKDNKDQKDFNLILKAYKFKKRKKGARQIMMVLDNEFKYKLVKECENYKKFAQEVFRECGIDPEIVGKGRIEASAHRWRKQLNYIGKITDTRTTNSGNTLKRELSDKEKLERAEVRINLLEAENEL